MINVTHRRAGWYWCGGGLDIGPYATSDHALRDAWLWCGAHVPALVFPRGAT